MVFMDVCLDTAKGQSTPYVEVMPAAHMQGLLWAYSESVLAHMGWSVREIRAVRQHIAALGRSDLAPHVAYLDEVLVRCGGRVVTLDPWDMLAERR